MKKYKMPNGRMYQFADSDVPNGAIPIETVKPEVKEEAKAIAPANKARKVSKK